jgi:hypothetical protein
VAHAAFGALGHTSGDAGTPEMTGSGTPEHPPPPLLVAPFGSVVVGAWQTHEIVPSDPLEPATGVGHVGGIIGHAVFVSVVPFDVVTSRQAMHASSGALPGGLVAGHEGTAHIALSGQMRQSFTELPAGIMGHAVGSGGQSAGSTLAPPAPSGQATGGPDTIPVVSKAWRAMTAPDASSATTSPFVDARFGSSVRK